MTLDHRLIARLGSAFFTEHPELQALRQARPDSGYDVDLDNNHQLGDANLQTQDGQSIPINEIEYMIYLQRLQELSVSNSANASSAATLLSSQPSAIIGRFLAEKRAGRLGNISAEAQSLETQLIQAISNISLSLHTYQSLPRTFQDHIAPNYFRDLAKAATCDANNDGEVTIQEVSDVIQRETDEQRRMLEPRVQALFNRADTNGDHQLSLDEFRLANHIESNSPEVMQRVQEVYNTQFDTDHQNGVSVAEFTAAQIPSVTPEQYRSQAQLLLVQARSDLTDAQTRFSPTLENDVELDRLSSRLSSFDLSYLNEGQIPTDVLNENNIFRVLTWMKSQCPAGQALITSDRVDELLQAHVLDIRPITQSLTGLVEIVGAPQLNIAEDQRRADVQVITTFLQRFAAVNAHGIITEEVLRDQILTNSLSLEGVNNAVAHLLAQLTQAGIPASEIQRLNRTIEEAMNPLSRLAGSDNTISREDLTRLLDRDRIRIVLRLLPNNQEFAENSVASALAQVSTMYENNRLPNEQGQVANDSDVSTPAMINRVIAQIRIAGRTTGLSDRKVESIIARFREEMGKRDLQGIQRPHFLETLWEKFPETRIDNPDASVYPLSIENPSTRIEGNQFLARALIHYAYLHPTRTVEIVQSTERRELFYLIEHVVAQGIHDRQRSHASDGVPGLLHYVNYLNPVQWFTGKTWRGRIAEYADARHEVRRQAIQALWDRLTGSRDANLNAALEALGNEEYKTILRDELHVPELERIFYITNSREQEEAYVRFATFTLRDQVNPEGSVLDAFRSRFAPTNLTSVKSLIFSQWQFRNGPAAATVYDRLIHGSEHAAIHTEASNGLRDLRGNTGDLNPLHWGYDFSDEEGSLDGIWDVVMQQVAIGAFMYGAGGGMRALFGMGGAGNRFITSVEFLNGWRNHPNWAARGTYWFLARPLSAIASLPLHRELSALEVEVVNDNAINYARTTAWGSRFRSFLYNQRANLEASRLLFHRNPQEAAARVLRLSQRMVRTSEEVFAESEACLRRAHNLSTNPNLTAGQVSTIEQELARAADLNRQAYSLRELAITQRSSMGIGVPDSTAYTSFNTQLTGMKDIVATIRSSAGSSGSLESHLTSIASHLEHLEATGTSMRGLSAYHQSLASRGAMAGAAGLASLAALSENTAASQAAARMIDPAAILAQNPAAQGQWQLYLLGWQKLHTLTLNSEYRNIPSLRDWALEQGLGASEMAPEQLMQAYEAQQRYRGSRAVYRNAFLNATREVHEGERIRDENLSFPPVNANPSER